MTVDAVRTADQRAAARRIDRALVALEVDVDSAEIARAIGRARAYLRLAEQQLAAEARARGGHDAIVADVAAQAATARLVGDLAREAFGS